MFFLRRTHNLTSIFNLILTVNHGIIQIAGVLDKPEAEMLLATGVDWLGFPLRLAHHNEDITEKQAAQIARTIHPPQVGVLITYAQTAHEIVALCHKLGVTKVQLHGKVEISEIKKLRTIAPEIFIIKSLIVGFDDLSRLLSRVDEFSPFVDAFITDTFDSETGACGATGKSHDWSISRKIVQHSTRPVFLAGGLNPQNVSRAIKEVQPAGVDSHTGVEDQNGRKDPLLVRAFVKHAQAAFRR